MYVDLFSIMLFITLYMKLFILFTLLFISYNKSNATESIYNKANDSYYLYNASGELVQVVKNIPETLDMLLAKLNAEQQLYNVVSEATTLDNLLIELNAEQNY